MTMGGPPGSSIASAGDAPMSMNCDDECVTEMAGACGGVALLVVLTLLLPRRGGRHLFARSGAPARDAVPPGWTGRGLWTVLTPTRMCLLRV